MSKISYILIDHFSHKIIENAKTKDQNEKIRLKKQKLIIDTALIFYSHTSIDKIAKKQIFRGDYCTTIMHKEDILIPMESKFTFNTFRVNMTPNELLYYTLLHSQNGIGSTLLQG